MTSWAGAHAGTPAPAPVGPEGRAAVPAALRQPGALDPRRPGHRGGAAVRRARDRRRRRATWRWCRRRSSCRSWCSRSRPGSGPTGWDRKRILIASDAVRLVTPAGRGRAAARRRARRAARWSVLAAVYGAADAFFAPAFSGLLPDTVAPANLQPANALRGLTYSVGSDRRPGDRRPADRLRGRPGRGAALRRRDVRGVDRPAAAAAAAGGRARRCRRGPARRPPTTSGPACGRAGVRCAAGRGCSASSAASAPTTLIVLPAIFVIGPVLMERRARRRAVAGR